MSKTIFNTAMVVAVSQAVSTRDLVHALLDDRTNMAQASAELEGCGDIEFGSMVRYEGPAEFAPPRGQIHTPAMDLGLAQIGAQGEAAPMPGDVKDYSIMTYAQAKRDGQRAQVSADRGNVAAQTNRSDSGSRAQVSSARGNLAQVSQTQTLNHTCQTAHQRNKGTNYNFNDISQTAGDYIDEQFPHNDALFWNDAGEAYGSMANISGITWSRIKDKYPADSLFWGSDGITPHDINQGQIGNCWFMAAASALAEKQGRIESIFVNPEVSQAGIYAVDLYAVGVPFTQIIDDYIPIKNGIPVFAKQGGDGSIWMPVLEKAFAKLHGNYEHIVGGWMAYGVSALNGSPFFETDHGDVTETVLWNMIKAHDDDDNIVTAGSHFCGSSQVQANGVACSHAYTVLHTYTLSGGTYDGTQLLKIRNPWGSEIYSGDWRDNDSKWTTDYRTQVDHPGASDWDGLFYMDIDSYYDNFSQTTVNEDTTGWNLGYYLHLDDVYENTSHIVQVKNTSPSTQEVFIGAHVWQDRSYGWDNNACSGITGWSYSHSITNGAQSETFNAWFGDKWLQQPVTLNAGESTDVIVNFNWTKGGATPDWSVTAWGTTGTVTVKKGDDNGDKFPEHDDTTAGDPNGCTGDCGTTPCTGDDCIDPIPDPSPDPPCYLDDLCCVYMDCCNYDHCEDDPEPVCEDYEGCCEVGDCCDMDACESDPVPVPDPCYLDDLCCIYMDCCNYDHCEDPEPVCEDYEGCCEAGDCCDMDACEPDPVPVPDPCYLDDLCCTLMDCCNYDHCEDPQPICEDYEGCCEAGDCCDMDACEPGCEDYEGCCEAGDCCDMDACEEISPGTQEAHNLKTQQISVPETDYFCYFDTKTVWDNGYLFWAGHDCEIYDLTLTISASEDDWASVEFISSDAIAGECIDIGLGDKACSFFLTPMNPKLGIKFTYPSECDLYYETEWTHCIDDMP